MATNWTELTNSQEYWLDKHGRWWGVRRFDSPDNNIVDNRDDLKTKSWTVNSIALTPRKLRIVSKTEHPGRSVIELHYHFPDNPYDYTSGQAHMSIQSWGAEERLTHDKNGDKLETEPDTDGLFWRVVQGTNIVLQAQSKIVITTAYAAESIDWATIVGLIGKTNSAQLSQTGFLTIEPGELLLLGAGVPDMYVLNSDNENVPIRYEFAYRPGGWPTTKAQKYWRGAIKEYVMHDTDDPDGDRKYLKSDGSGGDSENPDAFRMVVKDRPLGAPEARVIQDATGNFATLYGLLTWS